MAEHKDFAFFFPTDYFGSQHMPEDGSNMIVAIKDCGAEEVRNVYGKENKFVLHITAEPEKWIVNKTNAKMIAKVLGTRKVDEWVGQKIQLYVTKVPSPEGLVDAIRVREFAPKG